MKYVSKAKWIKIPCQTNKNPNIYCTDIYEVLFFQKFIKSGLIKQNDIINGTYNDKIGKKNKRTIIKIHYIQCLLHTNTRYTDLVQSLIAIKSIFATDCNKFRVIFIKFVVDWSSSGAVSVLPNSCQSFFNIESHIIKNLAN